jgi:OOP family OmpA-OmpF porin
MPMRRWIASASGRGARPDTRLAASPTTIFPRIGTFRADIVIREESAMNHSTLFTRSRVPVLVALWLFAVAAPVAGDPPPWYVVAKLGQASLEAHIGSPLRGWAVDGTETAASVEVGYRLHRNLSVQAGYHDLGSFTGYPRPCPEGYVCPAVYHLADASFSGLSLAAVPRLPVTERFSVHGKIGVLEWDSDVATPVTGEHVPEPSGTELQAGAGVQLVVSKGFGVVLDYEVSDLGSRVSAGAGWRFLD